MSGALPALEVGALSRLFKALSDDTRMRIVALLSHGELCVCHLERALDLPQPSVSRHLAILRSAGVVADRRDRQWVYYRLADQQDPERERHLGALVQSFGKERQLQRYLRQLVKERGPEACVSAGGRP